MYLFLFPPIRFPLFKLLSRFRPINREPSDVLAKRLVGQARLFQLLPQHGIHGRQTAASAHIDGQRFTRTPLESDWACIVRSQMLRIQRNAWPTSAVPPPVWRGRSPGHRKAPHPHADCCCWTSHNDPMGEGSVLFILFKTYEQTMYSQMSLHSFHKVQWSASMLNIVTLLK